MIDHVRPLRHSTPLANRKDVDDQLFRKIGRGDRANRRAAPQKELMVGVMLDRATFIDAVVVSRPVRPCGYPLFLHTRLVPWMARSQCSQQWPENARNPARKLTLTRSG